MVAQKRQSFYMSIHPSKLFLNSICVFEVDLNGSSSFLSDFNFTRTQVRPRLAERLRLHLSGNLPANAGHSRLQICLSSSCLHKPKALQNQTVSHWFVCGLILVRNSSEFNPSSSFMLGRIPQLCLLLALFLSSKGSPIDRPHLPTPPPTPGSSSLMLNA